MSRSSQRNNPYNLPPLKDRIRETFFTFFKFGYTSFGGPMVHTNMLNDEIVVKRGWVCRNSLQNSLPSLSRYRVPLRHCWPTVSHFSAPDSSAPSLALSSGGILYVDIRGVFFFASVCRFPDVLTWLDRLNFIFLVFRGRLCALWQGCSLAISRATSRSGRFVWSKVWQRQQSV